MLDVPKTDLQSQLRAFHDGMLERLSRSDAAAVRAAEQTMMASGLARNAPAPGALAPDFELADQHGRPVRLSERLGHGPVVLVFFRGGWCPFCSLTLRAYQAVLPALQRSHASLLAITPQRLDGCQSTADSNVLQFSLLSDHGHKVADAYEITYEIPVQVRPLYKRMNHELPKMNVTEDWRAPLPATFVIAPDGRVAASHVTPTLYQRMEPGDAVAAVHAIMAQAVHAG